jgi:sugar lactone lactonase YvrE
LTTIAVTLRGAGRKIRRAARAESETAHTADHSSLEPRAHRDNDVVVMRRGRIVTTIGGRR